jgi:hypothetical protein
MRFDQWKKEVFRLADASKKGHLVPDSNTLFCLWEKHQTPQQVVDAI